MNNFIHIIKQLKPALSEDERTSKILRKKKQPSFPENQEKYFCLITTAGQINVDKFNVNGTEYRLKKVHRFLDDIINQFISIVFADYAVFNHFRFAFLPNIKAVTKDSADNKRLARNRLYLNRQSCFSSAAIKFSSCFQVQKFFSLKNAIIKSRKFPEDILQTSYNCYLKKLKHIHVCICLK